MRRFTTALGSWSLSGSKGRRPLPLLSLVLLVTLGTRLAEAAEGPSPGAERSPFLRLRGTSLRYHGPSGDLTNLTEIRIGWFGPTNLADPLTGDLWWAAQFALRAEANRTDRPSNPRPSPRDSDLASLPFRLVPCWAIDPWGTGVSQLTRMVYDEQPLAIIGSIDSASTHLAEQVVAKANLPLISPIATDPSITLAGVPWMFSCAPSDAAVARVLVEDLLVARADGTARSGLALLTTTDHDSRMTTREVLRELSRRHRLPDHRFEAPPGVPNVERQLDALEAARPAAILIIAGAEDSARLVRAVRRTAPGIAAPLPADDGTATDHAAATGGSNPVVFGGPSMGRRRFHELVGPAGEGVRFPLVAPGDEGGGRFIEEFTSARQHAPDYAALLTYDATRLLLDAIRVAGPNRAGVRDGLSGLPSWPGIAGAIQFDGTGQNTRTNVIMAAWRNGRIEPTRSSRHGLPGYARQAVGEAGGLGPPAPSSTSPNPRCLAPTPGNGDEARVHTRHP